MKKNLLKDFFYTCFSKTLLVSLLSLCGFSLQAQIQNNGTVFVGTNATLYTNSVFVFGTGSVTEADRGTGSNYGKIIFGSVATTSGASSTTGQTLFVDGFASTLKNGLFELPTAQGSIYAPIAVSTSTVTNGVDAAFYSGALLSSNFNPVTINQLPT